MKTIDKSKAVHYFIGTEERSIVCFSQDGIHAAVVNYGIGTYFSVDDLMSVFLYNTQTNDVTPLFFFPTNSQKFEAFENYFYDMAISGDAKYIVTSGPRGYINLWDVHLKREIVWLEDNLVPGGVSCLLFTPDDNHILVGGYDETILFEIKSGSIVNRFDAKITRFNKLSVSQSGKLLLAVSNEKYIRLFRMDDAKKLLEYRLNSSVESVSISPLENQALIGCGDGKIYLWNFDENLIVRQWQHGSATLKTAEFFSSGDTQDIELMVAEMGKDTCVGFSPDGDYCLSGTSDDKTVSVWDVKTGDELIRFEHEEAVHHVKFSNDGKRVYSGCWDGSIFVWDLDV